MNEERIPHPSRVKPGSGPYFVTGVQPATFPLDWDEWRRVWRDWLTSHADAMQETRERFPGKNLLANESLGTWKVNGRTVELSEVTFPNLQERDPQTGRLLDYEVRAIGITYGVGVDGAGAVVHSFDELEKELGL